ncbi:muts domain V-domain-containing protein [Chytriomyces sp. MP71]|nr:muts domain V-domain-containing protein [Chytriomyces sp. MP71]
MHPLLLTATRHAHKSSALTRLLKRAPNLQTSVTRVRIPVAKSALRNAPPPVAVTTASSSVLTTAAMPGAAAAEVSNVNMSANKRASAAAATATVAEVLAVRAKHPQLILLVQVGSFYELYDYCVDNLDCLADELNLTVSSPPGGPRRAGFPLSQLERYITRISGANGLRRPVGIVDQVSRDHTSPGKNFTRAVTRIVTPGTPLPSNGEAVSESRENCFLLSISALPPLGKSESNEGACRIGLAWTDINTGEFVMFDSSPSTLSSDLARIAPTEIVCCADKLPPKILQTVKERADHDNIFVTLHHDSVLFETQCAIAKASAVQTRLDPLSALRVSLQSSDLATRVAQDPLHVRFMGQNASEATLTAAGALFGYLNEIFCGDEPHFHFNSDTMVGGGAREAMHIDAATMTSLEIVKTIRDHDRKGSLMSEIDQTKTAQGARLLASRLKTPSTNIHEIRRRHNLIAPFHTDIHNLLPTTQSRLVKIKDMERCLQRLHLRSAKVRDVINLLQSLEAVAELREFLRGDSGASSCPEVCKVVERLQPPLELVDRYKGVFADVMAAAAAVDDEEGPGECEARALGAALSRYYKGKFQMGIIGGGVSAELDVAREKLEECESIASALKEKLSAKYGTDLELMEDAKEGPCVSVASGKAGVKPQTMAAIQKDKHTERLRRQTLVTKHKFKHEAWTNLFNKRRLLEEHVIRTESAIFDECCQELRVKTAQIISTSEAVAEIDVSASMGFIAANQNYVKPEMVDDVIIDVQDARHPVVENMQMLRSQAFTANHLYLDSSTRVFIMTGPNMGGKSTFLRQSALLSIMAQAGFYVPATSARLGVMDAVYSRVGASDNLAGNQSTFRVEMEETANILSMASERSFIIMDEVGRGTSSQDGLAIACGILKRILSVNKSLALFATHYHELPLLLSFELGAPAGQEKVNVQIPGAKCVKTSMKFGKDKQFMYSYKVEDGVSDSSYGIEAALLAGLPSDVIEDATRLQHLLIEVRRRDEQTLSEMLAVAGRF